MGRGQGTVGGTASQRAAQVAPGGVELREVTEDEVVHNWDGRSFTPNTGPSNLVVDPTYINAYAGDRSVGTIMFRNFRCKEGEYGYPGYQSLESVYVLPEFRGQGVFLRLWAAMRRSAPDLRIVGDWKNKRLQRWAIAQTAGEEDAGS